MLRCALLGVLWTTLGRVTLVHEIKQSCVLPPGLAIASSPFINAPPHAVRADVPCAPPSQTPGVYLYTARDSDLTRCIRMNQVLGASVELSGFHLATADACWLRCRKSKLTQKTAAVRASRAGWGQGQVQRTMPRFRLPMSQQEHQRHRITVMTVMSLVSSLQIPETSKLVESCKRPRSLVAGRCMPSTGCTRCCGMCAVPGYQPHKPMAFLTSQQMAVRCQACGFAIVG